MRDWTDAELLKNFVFPKIKTHIDTLEDKKALLPWLIGTTWAVLKYKHPAELLKLLAKLLVFS